MCGILLNISFDETITDNHAALEIIAHRGPDGSGSINFDFEKFKIGLGHRRLSIIDLSDCGKQPMQYDNGNLWIIFNGEIYNYREIRKELESENYYFHSQTDTEVILASYKKWGKNCLNKFNGMFAFALYDKQNQSIFIARDRFGIKPLYYFNNSKVFRAASEIKQFLSIKNFSPIVNKEKLYHFLNTGDFSFDSETLWQNVNELEPGCFIEIDLKKWKPGDKLSQQKWYQPPFFESKIKICFDDAVCEFRKLLFDSVKLRLRSDVPLGFLLSGGLDSSTLVGIGHQLSRERTEHLKTYSTCYKNSKIDESKYIIEMIQFTNAEHLLHYPQPEEIAEYTKKVIWNNDIPIIQGSPVVHWLLYKKIKDENDSRKVIIEGQGGDEILCGYGDFYWAYLNEQIFSNPIHFFSEWCKFRKIHPDETYKIALKKIIRMNFPGILQNPQSQLINKGLLLQNMPYNNPISREEPSVSTLHYNRFKILRYILHNVDRNSMAHSREARTPFLDYRLVEFCLRLPSELKISAGLSKLILRSTAKGIIPEKILNRPDKQGYSSPTKQWLNNELKNYFFEMLQKSMSLPFINKKVLSDEINKIDSGKSLENANILWRIITTYEWFQIFKINFN